MDKMRTTLTKCELRLYRQCDGAGARYNTPLLYEPSGRKKRWGASYKLPVGTYCKGIWMYFSPHSSNISTTWTHRSSQSDPLCHPTVHSGNISFVLKQLI
jgi:hypothetical protein